MNFQNNIDIKMLSKKLLKAYECFRIRGCNNAYLESMLEFIPQYYLIKMIINYENINIVNPLETDKKIINIFNNLGSFTFINCLKYILEKYNYDTDFIFNSYKQYLINEWIDSDHKLNSPVIQYRLQNMRNQGRHDVTAQKLREWDFNSTRSKLNLI